MYFIYRARQYVCGEDIRSAMMKRCVLHFKYRSEQQ